MKTAVFLVNFVLLVITFASINSNKVLSEWEETKTRQEEYVIPNLLYPSDFTAVADWAYIIKQESLITWDINEKKVISTVEVEPNTIVDTDGEKVYLCSWENYEISSPEQPASVFLWREISREEREISIYKTARPIHCGKEEIIAVSTIPGLHEKYYRIKTQSGRVKELTEKSPGQAELGNIRIGEEGQIVVLKKTRNNLMERGDILLTKFLRWLSKKKV